MNTGIELIAEERKRQIEVEGWTLDHDTQHTNSELALAAAAYALPGSDNSHLWPPQWDLKFYNPAPHSRVTELIRAGALIAAEIDRLQKPERDLLYKENAFVKFLEDEIGTGWRDIQDGYFDYKDLAARIKDILNIPKS